MTTKRMLIMPVLLLAAGALLLAGCESDATAPQDQVPALRTQDAAQQAAFVAMAAAVVGPEVIQFSGLKTKDSYSRTYGPGDITGTVHLDYYTGGIGGTPATWQTGDWARLYTAEGEMLVVTLGDSGTTELTFDITAELDRDTEPDTATVSGGGTFASGVHAATFAFTGLVVTATGDYPTGGTLTFTAPGYVMEVAYDGDDSAVLSLDGEPLYEVNLDDGTITAITTN